MALMENVVDVVVDEAKFAHAEKVLLVRLRIGEIRDVIDELLEKCFRFLARNTLAADASLEIEKVPLVVKCTKCGYQYEEHISNYASMCCPKCKDTNLSMISGYEFVIEDIEIV